MGVRKETKSYLSPPAYSITNTLTSFLVSCCCRCSLSGIRLIGKAIALMGDMYLCTRHGMWHLSANVMSFVSKLTKF